ncbi:L-amino-acid oxidase-like [Platysternon megacephalum]|uniref:L-amino-acid oxidase-like n=1 Tax=Platysternon megacephalum TaxID=55544 RepID=A0A4D9DSE9_9SAUR|nr:L-amino-acid oxidase-like [Platysternon megacephalum]
MATLGASSLGISEGTSGTWGHGGSVVTVPELERSSVDTALGRGKSGAGGVKCIVSPNSPPSPPPPAGRKHMAQELVQGSAQQRNFSCSQQGGDVQGKISPPPPAKKYWGLEWLLAEPICPLPRAQVVWMGVKSDKFPTRQWPRSVTGLLEPSVTGAAPADPQSPNNQLSLPPSPAAQSDFGAIHAPRLLMLQPPRPSLRFISADVAGEGTEGGGRDALSVPVGVISEQAGPVEERATHPTARPGAKTKAA